MVNYDEEEVEVITEEEDKIPMEEVRIKSLEFKNAFTPIRRFKRITKVFHAIRSTLLIPEIT